MRRALLVTLALLAASFGALHSADAQGLAVPGVPSPAGFRVGMSFPPAPATVAPSQAMYDGGAGTFSGSSAPYSYVTASASMTGSCAAGQFAYLAFYGTANAQTISGAITTTGGDTFSSPITVSVANRHYYLFAKQLAYPINAGDTITITAGVSSNGAGTLYSTLACAGSYGSAIQTANGDTYSQQGAGTFNPSISFIAPAHLIGAAFFTSNIGSAVGGSWVTLGGGNGANQTFRWYYQLNDASSPDTSLSTTTGAGNVLMGQFPLTP